MAWHLSLIQNGRPLLKRAFGVLGFEVSNNIFHRHYLYSICKKFNTQAVGELTALHAASV